MVRIRTVLIGATAAGCAIILGGAAFIATAGQPQSTQDTDVAHDAVATSSPQPSRMATQTPRPSAVPHGSVRAWTLPAVDQTWLSARSESTGIPARALAAYAGTALSLSAENPGCRLDWATLAAIGLVESEHGRIHGGSIDARGKTRPSIIGIALDGSSTATIVDSDGGNLDGDTEWDRAVGPMQIIPETWYSYASDGNGDGIADPQQIDDAALTAGRYLCATVDDLSDRAQWIAAISVYNLGADYNNRVAAATETYARLG